MRFRKKCTEGGEGGEIVEAERLTGSAMVQPHVGRACCAYAGEWVVTDVRGYRAVCSNDTFQENYEPIWDTEKTAQVLLEILQERARQFEVRGKQDHALPYWYCIFGEEFGEIAKAILEGDLADVRTELIQSAAVAVAIIECIDRLDTVPLDVSGILSELGGD